MIHCFTAADPYGSYSSGTTGYNSATAYDDRGGYAQTASYGKWSTLLMWPLSVTYLEGTRLGLIIG